MARSKRGQNAATVSASSVDVISTSEACELLGLSFEAFRKRVSRSKVHPYSGVGRSAVYRRGDISGLDRDKRYTRTVGHLSVPVDDLQLELYKRLLSASEILVVAKDSQIADLSAALDHEREQTRHWQAIAAMSSAAAAESWVDRLIGRVFGRRKGRVE